MKLCAFLLAMLLLATSAYAQSSVGGGNVSWIGPIIPMHCAEWFAPGVLEDAGANCGSGGGSVSITAGSTNIVVSPSPLTGTGTVDLGASPSITTSLTTPYINVTTTSTGIEMNSGIAFYYNSADSGTAGSSMGIGVGTLSGQTGTTHAYQNLAIGYNAMNGTMTSAALDNLAVGYKALTNLTQGTLNVAIGANTATGLTTGNYNTFVGGQAGGNGTITGSTGATGVGYNALGSLTTSVGNTAVGYQALNSIGSSGSNNTAVGYDAMQSSYCTDCVAMGYQALNNPQATSRNIAIGYQPLEGGLTFAQSDDIAIGSSAGKSLTTGAGQNVMIGTSALGSASATSAHANTVIGYEVGSVELQTGSGNILIGTSTTTDTNGTADTAEIAIGGAGLGSDTTEIGLSGTTTSFTAYGAPIFPNIAADTGQTDATVCAVTASGHMYYGTGTGGICLGTSSKRFKRKIKPLVDGIAQIEALKPVNFYYRHGYGDNGAKRQYGFLAEDVVHVLPGLVGKDKDDKPSSVDMLGMVPVVVESIQQQQEDIRDLKDQIAELEHHAGLHLHKCLGFLPFYCEDK